MNVENTELNGKKCALTSKFIEKLRSLDLRFFYFIWCSDFAKHLVQISKEQIQKLTQMPIVKTKITFIFNILPSLLNSGLWLAGNF